MHANVFVQGRGNTEKEFYFWFDPTADFHTILWNPHNIMYVANLAPAFHSFYICMNYFLST